MSDPKGENPLAIAAACAADPPCAAAAGTLIVATGLAIKNAWDRLFNKQDAPPDDSAQPSPEEPSGLGDLTNGEVGQIQDVVDAAGRPLAVVGSAATGERKEGSDIDYVVGPSSLPHYEGKENDLPSIDPEHGIIPGVPNPHEGPAIQFEPGAPPKFIPAEPPPPPPPQNGKPQ